MLLAPIAAGVVVALTAVDLNAIAAADKPTGTKQSQPAPSSPPSVPTSPAPDAIDATVLAFDTSQYTVRIFRQAGDLRMNLYNRQADKAEQTNLPMQVHVADTGITFTNRGDRSTVYSVEVAPDGSKYRLKIQQGDRVTYNQQVAHTPAPTASASPAVPAPLLPSPMPSVQPSVQPVTPTATAAAPTIVPPSTSSQDLAPRQPIPTNPVIPDSATIAKFQTAKYVVRIYDDSGEVRMNIYNRSTNQLELKASPVQSTRSGQNTTYTNPSGALTYAAIVEPVGGYRLQTRSGQNTTYTNPSGALTYAAIVEPVGGYRLQVREGDRVIYSELGY